MTGAGVIDAVGDGVDERRVGWAVWCYGAQSYRPLGTAADFVAVPAQLAVDLPTVGDKNTARQLAEQGGCLGIAGITGRRAVFGDGPVPRTHGLGARRSRWRGIDRDSDGRS